MSEKNKKGYLVRAMLQNSRECLILNHGTDYEVKIFYNGVTFGGLGRFAVKNIGKNAFFYQHTKRMEGNPEEEEKWMNAAKEKHNTGFLNRNMYPFVEYIVVNKGTDYEATVTFNGTRKKNFGLVAHRGIGKESKVFHLTSSILENKEEAAKWQ